MHENTLVERLCFGFRHKDSRNFRSIWGEMKRVNDEREQFWSVNECFDEELKFLSRILSGFTEAEDFFDFASRGLNSWSEVYDYLRFLGITLPKKDRHLSHTNDSRTLIEQFNYPRYQMFPVAPILRMGLPEKDLDKVYEEIRRDNALGFLGDMRQAGWDNSVLVSEHPLGKTPSVLADIDFGYRFKDNPQIVSEVVRIVSTYKHLLVPIIRQELRELKSTTAQVTTNQGFRDLQYGKHLSDLLSQLNLDGDPSFSRQVSYSPTEISVPAKKKGPLLNIHINSHSGFSCLGFKRNPSSHYIFIRNGRGTPVMAAMYFGINLSGTNGIDPEHPQFKTLRSERPEFLPYTGAKGGLSSWEMMCIGADCLKSALEEIVRGRKAPVSVYVSDSELKKWFRSFIEYRAVENKVNVAQTALGSLELELDELVPMLFKQRNGRRKSPFNSPEEYQIFIQTLYERNQSAAANIHRNIMSYEKENSQKKVREANRALEDKLEQAQRLFREDPDVIKAAAKAVEAKKRQRRSLFNPRYGSEAYSQVYDLVVQGSRIPVPKVDPEIWDYAPFYKVDEHIKTPHDICPKIDPDIVCFKLYPGMRKGSKVRPPEEPIPPVDQQDETPF